MSESEKMKHLTCVVAGCTATFRAPTEEDLMKQVATHAATDHGVTNVTPELAAKVKAAIRTE